ncbi:MAG: metallophosphoesterase [Pseudonocardiaceae bacterium]
MTSNDFHSALPAGQAMLEHIAHWRSTGAVIVDSGDFFEGSAFHEFSAGWVEERLLAELYDAIVPGNHDLAYLRRLARPSEFPTVVCANLRPRDKFPGRWTSGLLFEGTSPAVGIVGYLGQQAYWSVPAVERAGYTFTEPTPRLLAAKRDRLRAAGADLVLGVSHSGFQADVAAQKTESVFDVVVAGHCHSNHYYWSNPQGTRHVIKAPENGSGLARIELRADGSRCFAIEHWEPDAHQAIRHELNWLAEVIESYRHWAAEPIGHLSEPLPDRTALAIFVASRAQQVCASVTFVLNQGAIRAGTPMDVRREHLVNAIPFDSEIVVISEVGRREDVTTALDRVGEKAVWSRVVQGPIETLGCTRYLAERLGLNGTPVKPSCTLRDVFVTTTMGDSRG